MKMEYNTASPLMIIPEYGRHVQKMAQYLLTIKDRKERTRGANTVIQTMTQVHPYAKDSEELRRKLWDHLYIITDYKLEVDGPYPKPLPELIEAKPKRMEYPVAAMRYRHYGKIISGLIKKAMEYKDSGEKDALVESIASLMKKAYMTWNQSSVNDQAIISDLTEMSGGKLILKDTTKLSNVYVPLNVKPVNTFNRKNKKNKNNRGKDKKRRHGGF
ncbi:MAG TPA: DUF4290 domain-containing protein [Bacteroidia bacterium]|jgi:hypothetical protein|nr:DUF4290 domain-containing protein [Bacteroidia bacterium]